jgi:hypothetical protein
VIILNFVKQCLTREKQNEKLSISEMGDILKLYEDTVDLCFETLYNISGRTSGKLLDEEKATSFLIAIRILSALQSIRHLTVKGYYYQASVLMRSFFESLGLCIYLSKHLEEAERWIEGKKLNITSIDLFEYIPKTLFDKYDSNLRAVYGMLCDYVHTNYIAVCESTFIPDNFDIVLLDGKERVHARISIPSEFDGEKIKQMPYFPLLFLATLLKTFQKGRWNTKTRKLYHDLVLKYGDILDENDKDSEKT